MQVDRNLVMQTYRLFGSHHYNHYDFLFSLSDQLTGNGLEHHRSSEDGTRASYFTGWHRDAQESDFEKEYDSAAATRHIISFTFSIGLTLTNTGEIEDVRWNGPAFKAGVSSGATLVAVNGQNYSPAVLTDAIVAAEHNGEPITLALNYQGGYKTIAVAYHDGLQYPHLVRVNGSSDYLDEIIAAKK